MDYVYETEPYAHQREEFEQNWSKKTHALFWEMGTGKTKPTIDTLSALYEAGEIKAVIVIAPKAVAPNWSRTEIPIHMPKRVRKQTRTLLWRTDKANNKGYQAELRNILTHEGLIVICMSYDAIMTSRKPGQRIAGRAPLKGHEFVLELIKSRSTMLILDESARIKNPGAKRTKRIQSFVPYSKYRRILTGTPISNSPFDIWAQVRFLSPFFWAKHGCNSMQAFKTRFAVWLTLLKSPKNCPHDPTTRPNCGCPTFPKLVDYKNIDDLNAIVSTVGSRLLKADVLPHLPPKMFDIRNFHLSKGQQKIYDELKREFMVWLQDGDMITAPLVITQLLRLQEITSGYCPTDGGDMLIDPDNARVDVLREVVEDCPHEMIIWAKFKHDFKLIGDMLTHIGVDYVEYRGDTSADDRETARDRFQDGDVKVFLASAQCAGEGLTLTRAQTVVYYNTTFRLMDRLQSEDRAHRSGQEHPVQYIDIVAEGTVDERIIDSLRTKKDLADQIMGDPRGQWL